MVSHGQVAELTTLLNSTNSTHTLLPPTPPSPAASGDIIKCYFNLALKIKNIDSSPFSFSSHDFYNKRPLLIILPG